MAEDQVQGCVQPAEGPIVSEPEQSTTSSNQAVKEKSTMQVMVGKEAPDFGASAFTKDGFSNVRLSDYKGKWVFLCFYPGDFTFV